MNYTMKKTRYLATLLMIITLFFPINVRAAEQSEEVVQHGTTIAFTPVVTFFERQKSSMVINLDTVDAVFMWQVQLSDSPDFSRVENRYFKNIYNHGGMCIVMEPIKENGKTYNTRTIWYGGHKMSFRKVLRKHSKDRLVTTQGVVNGVRNKIRMKKRLYIPIKKKYVRVRCIYYGSFYYAYSKWVNIK